MVKNNIQIHSIQYVYDPSAGKEWTKIFLHALQAVILEEEGDILAMEPGEDLELGQEIKE